MTAFKEYNDTQIIIMQATISLIAAKGISSVSIRDISKATSLKAPSIYYHFENKEGLIFDTIFYIYSTMQKEFNNLNMDHLSNDKDKFCYLLKNIYNYLSKHCDQASVLSQYTINHKIIFTPERSDLLIAKARESIKITQFLDSISDKYFVIKKLGKISSLICYIPLINLAMGAHLLPGVDEEAINIFIDSLWNSITGCSNRI